MSELPDDYDGMLDKTFLGMTNTADIQDIGHLKDRIADYIAFCVRRMSGPAKLATINRRFNSKAHKLNTSSREIVDMLCVEGRVQLFVRHGASILIDTKWLQVQELVCDDSAEQMRALEMTLQRAE